MTAFNQVIKDEMQKARLIRRLRESPLRDEAGRTLHVVIQRISKPRSLPQNSLYWAWLKIASDFTGATINEMHEALKLELLPRVEKRNPITGEVTMQPISTAGMSKLAFAEYMDKVQALVLEHFDIRLPPPNDDESWAAFQAAKASDRAA